MPTNTTPSCHAPSQAQSTPTPTPSRHTDADWHRLSSTLARVRGLSLAARILADAEMGLLPADVAEIHEATATLTDVLAELCANAHERCSDIVEKMPASYRAPDVMREAHGKDPIRYS